MLALAVTCAPLEPMEVADVVSNLRALEAPVALLLTFKYRLLTLKILRFFSFVLDKMPVTNCLFFRGRKHIIANDFIRKVWRLSMGLALQVEISIRAAAEVPHSGLELHPSAKEKTYTQNDRAFEN